MSSAESDRRGPEVLLTVGVYLALLASLYPLLRVVSPGAWLIGVGALPAVVLAVGLLARRSRMRAVAVSLLETAALVLVLTVVFLGDTAFLGFIPMPASIGRAAELVTTASDEIINGSAPVEPTAALSFLIVAAVAVLTVAIDHVVLTARMPLLAAVGLISVSLIPAISVPRDVDILGFVLLAAALLFLLRAETRSREGERDRGAARVVPVHSGVATAAATGIGAIAVVVALVAAPLFPADARPGSGIGGRWNSIDPSLQLGDDLRRPTDAEVLRVTTTGAGAPYLRAATLSNFDGRVWRPDLSRSLPLTGDGTIGPLGAPAPDPDVRMVEAVTDVEIVNLIGGWLPIPFPAVKVTGLDGEWSVMPSNRTVVSRASSSNGQHYEVSTETPRPTLEQIRAATADTGERRDATRTLPVVMPDVIPRTAREVTAGTTNDYDRLIALQNWFRSSEFEYSLDAPVEDGFDGTGSEAIAQFLSVKRGYCIHFASAFALMARTLGMSTRIVVGYLPGVSVTDPITQQRYFSVVSSQLHAWPEVYFSGIGWIPFEPTNSLGVPTSFLPASAPDPVIDGPDAGPTPTPTASAGPGASIDPQDRGDIPDEAIGATADPLRPLPWLAGLLAVVVVLLVPSVIGALRRRTLVRAARRGDAAAAWLGVQDAALDLALPLPPGESPRALGARLVATGGAPPADMQRLVDAIERASYASSSSPGDLSGPLRSVRAGMLDEAERSRRALALFLPRSLIVRVGSVYAQDGAHPTAR